MNDIAKKYRVGDDLHLQTYEDGCCLEYYGCYLEEISIPIPYKEIDNMIEALKDIKCQRENNE